MYLFLSAFRPQREITEEMLILPRANAAWVYEEKGEPSTNLSLSNTFTPNPELPF